MYVTLYQRSDEIFSSFSVRSRIFVQKELSAISSPEPSERRLPIADETMTV